MGAGLLSFLRQRWGHFSTLSGNKVYNVSKIYKESIVKTKAERVVAIMDSSHGSGSRLSEAGKVSSFL